MGIGRNFRSETFDTLISPWFSPCFLRDANAPDRRVHLSLFLLKSLEIGFESRTILETLAVDILGSTSFTIRKVA